MSEYPVYFDTFLRNARSAIYLAGGSNDALDEFLTEPALDFMVFISPNRIFLSYRGKSIIQEVSHINDVAEYYLYNFNIICKILPSNLLHEFFTRKMKTLDFLYFLFKKGVEVVYCPK